MTYLDTHVAIWLYAGRMDLLSGRARDEINRSSNLLISPAVALETEFFREIGKLSVGAMAVYQYLHTAISLSICELEFGQVVQAALSASWTRDPFDRLIVAQAIVGKRPLITRDEQIRANYPGAVW